MTSQIKELVLLGDSHLARTSEDAGVALLPRFTKDFPDTHITNLAHGGVDTNYGLAAVTYANLPKSFTAIVLFGSNDAAPWKQVPLEKFSKNFRQILSVFKTKGASKIIVFSPPPVNIHKQTPPGRSNEELSKYAQAVENISTEFKVEYVDLFAILSQDMKNTDIHYSDGIHLNSAGYDIFYSNIKKVLKKLI